MDVIAREVRHHDVEDDHVGRMSAQAAGLDPVARADALIPGVTQRFDDDLRTASSSSSTKTRSLTSGG